MRLHIVVSAVLAAVALDAAAGTAQVHPPSALTAPAVVRVPAFATQPTLRVDPNAPLQSGEFASAIRTPADRAALADAIAKQRYAESQKWAADGPGIVVQLRRSRY
ncbi:MAG: hypothetical protein M3169_16920 [Candidatus Eremiobacteraeota bacterium]|nr:hypothetical protein [Candidatus Eremiobacteraeota bacterium]